MARNGRSMRADECLFMGESGCAADITAMTDFEPQAVFGSFHRTCLVTDSAMDAWYHPFCMNDPQPRGSHGKPYRTTKVLTHAGRRAGRMAARRTSAADGEATNTLKTGIETQQWPARLGPVGHVNGGKTHECKAWKTS